MPVEDTVDSLVIGGGLNGASALPHVVRGAREHYFGVGGIGHTAGGESS